MKKVSRWSISAILVASAVSGNLGTTAQADDTHLMNDDFEGASWSLNPTDAASTSLGSYNVLVSSNKGAAWIYNPQDNYAQITSDPLREGNRAIKLYDNQDGAADKGGAIRIYNRSFTPQTAGKTVITEFDFMAEKVGSSTRFRLTNAGINTALASLELDGKGLVYRKADGTTASLLPSIQAGTWYHVKLEVDMTREVYSVFVSGGGTAELRGEPFNQKVTDFGNIDINTGNSSVSTLYVDNIQVYNPSIVPAAPAGVTAEAGNTQVKLSWNPASNASSYTVKRSTSPDGSYTTVQSNITDLAFRDTGLQNETTYYYKISGVNSVGEGTGSAAVSVTPSSAVPLPQAPAGISASSRNASINLSWEAVQGADSYTIKRSTSPDGPFVEAASNVTTPSYWEKGLNNDTAYYYKVQANGIGGQGSDSETISVMPATPQPHPANVTAQSGDQRVDLAWSPADSADAYIVKRSTTDGGPYTTLGKTSSLSYSDTEVQNGSRYYYVVTAVHGTNESMISDQVKGRPEKETAGAPKAPAGFKAETGDQSVELTWDKSEGASFYTVKRSEASGGPYTAIAEKLTSPSYTDREAAEGKTYYYVVSASDEKGESRTTDEQAAEAAQVIQVAKDGTGDFDTIQGAVDSIPADNSKRVVISIKDGLYKEKVAVTQPYVSFTGESRTGTIIEWDDYGGTNGQSGNVGSTFKSQTVGITGDYFTASSLTILNSRAPRSEYGTAVALSVKSDQAVFEQVNILGHQDTLYTGSGRQYYRDAYIEGDVDFIFGEAPAVVFDRSEIRSVGTNGYVTAAAQAKESDPGLVFLNSRLTKADSATKVYLGRPWKNYADTTFINTWMDSHIMAQGWSEWSGKLNHEQASYAEYNSTGPGANAKSRVGWSRQLTAAEASELTVPGIFEGWNPAQKTVPHYISEQAEVKHEVSFYADNGSAVQTQTVHDQETAVKPADPAKEGYTFAGWYTDEQGQHAFDFTQPVTETLVLYAQWTTDREPVKVEVTEDMLDQTGNTIELAAPKATPRTKFIFTSAAWDIIKTAEKDVTLNINGAAVTIPVKSLLAISEATNDNTTVTVTTEEAQDEKTDAVFTSNILSIEVADSQTNQTVTSVSEPMRIAINMGGHVSAAAQEAQFGASYNEETDQWQYAGGKLEDSEWVIETRKLTSFAVLQNSRTFDDIQSHWAKTPIEQLASRFIVYGTSDTAFSPDESVTRAQFAVLLARMLNIPTTELTGTFKDVTAGQAWSAAYIEAAGRMGIVSGFPDGTFHPGQVITRQEMAAMIVRAMKVGDPDVIQSTEPPIVFKDASGISPRFKEEIQIAARAGLIKGRNNGNFDPLANATRGETSAILYRILTKQ
ncbi:pectinesterase family protein [Domibacillus sp. PGB-M46]|uniref:pectinesterase family protein n=1 Tax=Domibacillus sp. PGB-M46 TaxID=2910255 RepID=UPI001F5A1459|nr:pectinesterase family protein [Domibacillus sp. PGB-M46]MCI2253092.1 pectinesterase family protein [Domibacillus sp. PGB-M46]